MRREVEEGRCKREVQEGGARERCKREVQEGGGGGEVQEGGEEVKSWGREEVEM